MLLKLMRFYQRQKEKTLDQGIQGFR